MFHTDRVNSEIARTVRNLLFATVTYQCLSTELHHWQIDRHAIVWEQPVMQPSA